MKTDHQQERPAWKMSRRGFVSAATMAAAMLGLSGAAALADDGKKDGVETPADKPAEDGPYTVVDRLDREITFDKIPERVAMTIMPMPAIFYQIMGNTDMIVGCNPSSITAYEDSTLKTLYPELANAETDWCGSDFSVNIEELLKLKPDVVFQWVSEEESVYKMEEAGLKVVALKYGTLDEMKRFFTLVGEVFRKQDRVEFLIDYFDKKTAQVTDRIATLEDDQWLKAIELYGDMSVYSSGFMDYWITGAGTINPANDGIAQGSVTVDMEQILVWDPDFIWIGNFTPIKASDLLENKLEGEDWSMIRAVQEGNVYKIPIGGYRWDPPSLESPLVLQWMAQIVHPELFEDIDMEEELRTFYKDIYDFDITDEMIDMVRGDVQD